MVEDYVEWCDAYNHIKTGGMAQHKSWNPYCKIKLSDSGEIVFEDGTECWLDLEELTSHEWILLPSGEVWKSFEQFPELAKTLTINSLTTKLWYEKGKLHRKLYDYYQEKGSLSILKGGWGVSYREELGFVLDLNTSFNPLSIYTSEMQDAKDAYAKYTIQYERIVELERTLARVQTGLLNPKDLQTIYLKVKDMN